jgi:hypothetical protein
VLAPAAAAHNRVAAHKRKDVILSNETTYTTWTIADVVAPIRTQPSEHARIITMLRMQQPDGSLQSYVLLRKRWTRGGWWVYLRIPMRPNGKTGWVKRSNLDQFQTVYTELVVDRDTRQLTLYRHGKAIFHGPVGVGKPSTPTPAGHFWITEKIVSYNPFYGPYLLGTSDYSALSEWPGGGIVGLHGTNEPWLVPGDPSHGCIRMHNADISWLWPRVPVGTAVLVK